MVLGIFDFIAELLVGLSTWLLQIIDWVMEAVNKISGVEDITVNGESTDFMTYLIRTDRVAFAFGIAAILGIILIFLFSAIQIIVLFTKDKVEETPIQVVKKAFKNFIILLLVPTFMLAFMALTNAFVRAMYDATLDGSSSLGQFMFEIFAEDAWSGTSPFIGNNPLSYKISCGDMWSYIDLWDYHFFYSYLIGGLVLYALFGTALMLVERAISITLLYIISPFAVASSILDDGAKFKSWRDQIFIKFFTGHGAILAINVYMLVVSVLISSEVKFFDNGAINSFVKLVFITGGAFSLKSVQAVIGNLFQIGAGDKAVAEAGQAAGATGHLLNHANPLHGLRNTANFVKDMQQYGDRREDGSLRKWSAFGSTLANRMGFKTGRDYGKWSQAASADRNSLNNKNRNNNPVQNAIEGQNNQQNNNNKSNQNNNLNNNDKKSAGQNMVENAIANAANNNNNNS